MNLNGLKKHLGIFISVFLLSVMVITVYKTFDNLSIIFEWLHSLGKLLTPFFIGLALAYLLHLPCSKIEKWISMSKVKFLNKNKRAIATISIYVVFLIAVILLLSALIPAIVKSLHDFLEQLPGIVMSFVDWFNSLNIYHIDLNAFSVHKILSSDFFSLPDLINKFFLSDVNKYYKGVLSVGTWFFNAFMGIIISIYLLLDRKNLKNGTMRLIRLYIRPNIRKVSGKYLRQIDNFIKKYIYCMFIDAGIVFILSFLALALLRVKYALVFALIVALLNLIPYFGATIGVILTALVTVFTGGFTRGIIVAVVLIILQQLDGNLIQPKILSGQLEVKPVWVIFGVVIGGGLFGILGIFLAVPVIALLRIILLDMMDSREKKLNAEKIENQTQS